MDPMATYLELQTRVSERVIDLPPTVVNRVPILVNQAIRSLQRRYNYRAMEGSVVFITTHLSLTPTPNTILNFKEYRDKGPYRLDYLTKARRFITASQPDADLALLSNIDLPLEPQFLISAVDHTTGATTFSLSPYPDDNSDWPDTAYRIVVPYYAYSANLVNAGDQNWFTNFADDYIELQAASEAFGLDWDYQSMALLAQQADTKRKEVEKADKTSRLASVDTFVPMWRGANQPQVRK